MWLATTVSLLLCSLLLPADRQTQRPQRPPVDPAVKKDGWWIRLNTESKADRITWTFSEPGKKDKTPVTFTWERGTDPDNFDLPEPVRVVGALSFSMTAEPTTAAASFCVFYASHGVMLVKSSSSEKHTLNSQARDKGCTP
jgi:hypothetical protein